MISDKEVLLLAAKAYGIEDAVWWESADNPPFPVAQCVIYYADGDPCPKCFNPLHDDGDALRLAAKLMLIIDPQSEIDGVWVGNGESSITEKFGKDVMAATRRAIVRAAAETGRRL